MQLQSEKNTYHPFSQLGCDHLQFLSKRSPAPCICTRSHQCSISTHTEARYGPSSNDSRKCTQDARSSSECRNAEPSSFCDMDSAASCKENALRPRQSPCCPPIENTHYCASALHLDSVCTRASEGRVQDEGCRSYAPVVEETHKASYVFVPWWECILKHGLVPYFRDVCAHRLREGGHEPSYGRRCTRSTRRHCRGWRREQVGADKFTELGARCSVADSRNIHARIRFCMRTVPSFPIHRNIESNTRLHNSSPMASKMRIPM